MARPGHIGARRPPVQLSLALPRESARFRYLGEPATISWLRLSDGAEVEIHTGGFSPCRLSVRVGQVASLDTGAPHPALRAVVRDASDIFGVSFLAPRRREAQDAYDDALHAQLAAAPESAPLVCELGHMRAHLVSICDPRARRWASRFSRAVRPRVYELLKKDSSGRLAQLSTTCPGALLFALALVDAREEACLSAANTLLSHVVSGRTLDNLLDEALLTWADAAVRTGERDGEGAGASWRAVAGATASERGRLLQTQRLLIRRAGAWVTPADLWLPPPIAFAPEDIPGDRRLNALWFQAMKSHEGLLYRKQAKEPLRSLAMFLSKHALNPDLERWVIDRLLSFVEARDRCLKRTASLESALEHYEEWQAKRHMHPGKPGLAQVVQSVRRLADVTVDCVRALPLPQSPVAESSRAGIEVWPLRSAGELIDDGVHMRHCVAGRLPDILQGRCAVYSANVSGQRLTVEVREDLFGRWRLGDVRGKHNRHATGAERQVLQQWMSKVVAMAGGGHAPLPVFPQPIGS